MKKTETITKQEALTLPTLPNTVKHLISGAVSGGIARTVTAPFERTIILQQTKNPMYLNQRVFQILVNMGKKEGLLSFFKGNGTNVMRIMPFTAVELFTFEIYKQHLFKLLGDNQDYKKTVYFLAGAGAGLSAATVVYPLDLVRTLLAFQTNNAVKTGIIGSWKNIIKDHGFFGLYKGLGATWVGILPYASLKLAFFQLLKNNFQSKKTQNMDLANLISGGIAGCGAVTITYPTDLMRRRLQIRVLQNAGKLGYIELIRDIYAKEGLIGFYRGLPATYLKLIPSTAITFMLNEKIKKQWNIH